jgi:uncharacterized protein YlxW (UPF0749 family)
MKIKGNHVILSVILLITGFMISFSYHITNHQTTDPLNNKEWERRNQLRTTLLSIQSTNRELREKLTNVQVQVREREKAISEHENTASNLVEELNQLRMITGKVKVVGEGVSVTLSDSSYIPENQNPNDYIVHEEHIRDVVNEVLVSGAEAVAVNGQRVSNQTSIVCIGPVVSVDGVPYPAPFEITAIGDSEILESSLYLTDNTVDKLVNDGVEVRVEKLQEIIINPTLHVEG